ncbi:hypothetical protein BN1723_019159, partial [Verticillium longisporum]
ATSSRDRHQACQPVPRRPPRDLRQGRPDPACSFLGLGIRCPRASRHRPQHAARPRSQRLRLEDHPDLEPAALLPLPPVGNRPEVRLLLTRCPGLQVPRAPELPQLGQRRHGQPFLQVVDLRRHDALGQL